MTRSALFILAALSYGCTNNDGLNGVGGDGGLPHDDVDSGAAESSAPVLSDASSTWEYYGEPYFSDVIWTTADLDDPDDDVAGGSLVVQVEKDGEAYDTLLLEVGSGDSILEDTLLTFVIQVPDLSAAYELQFYVTDLAENQSNTVETTLD